MRRNAAWWGALVLIGWIVALNGCCADRGGPSERLPRSDRALRVDDGLEIALRYAPIVYHEVDPDEFRADLPARVDFDGTIRGDDNWENLPRFAIAPTLYYTVLETATHVFVAYHVFHPRDFAWLRIGLHETHENDGENLQVVVDKSSGRIVLLLTQAHYRARAHVAADSGFGSGDEAVHRGLHLDADGRPQVFVESGGHGIHAVGDDAADVDVDAAGRVSFQGRGIVLRPAAAGEAIDEPTLETTADESPARAWPYQLESTLVVLWDGVRDGSLLGDGGILDGACVLQSRLGEYPVPRYYEADRFSGPFGPDRGIAPFAIDFDFDCGEVGALFFDPAARYAARLRVPQPWSLEYSNPIAR